jgi:uncharacterized Tic20 family protein
MGRLVRIPQKASSASEPGIIGVPGIRGEARPPAVVEQDGYLERIAKYVPAEVLAFSIFINAILDQAMRTGGRDATMAGIPVMTIALIALVAGTLLAPFFVWYVREDGDDWITNAAVSCVAFPFWSYALGAVAFTGYRDGNLAAILVATFTVMSGVVKPRAPKQRQVMQAREPSRDGPRVVELPTAMGSSGS